MRHASANDGGLLLGVDRLRRGPHRLALVSAPDRLAQPEAEHDEDAVGTAKTMNGARQPNAVGEQAGRAAARGTGRRALAARWNEYTPGAAAGGVVVGEQRVVGRVDHRPADAGAGAGDRRASGRRGRGR